MILDAVEDIIGPNILCWSSNFFIKEANEKTFVSWHQDFTYWGRHPENVITAWIALSDASLSTGPMQVVPGSQKWDNESNIQTHDKLNLLSRGQKLNRDMSKEKVVSMPLNAGEISPIHKVIILRPPGPFAKILSSYRVFLPYVLASDGGCSSVG